MQHVFSRKQTKRLKEISSAEGIGVKDVVPFLLDGWKPKRKKKIVKEEVKDEPAQTD